jgi:hypothetical protein
MRLSTRLAATVGLVYLIHFAPNVVRETYLAVALGERGSIRVDDYLGLHPDLFAIEGRGAYINNNPGASLLAAIPYAVARPAVDAVLRLKPEFSEKKAQAAYDDPRPNRTRFLNEARSRGLDVKLGLAAAVIHAGLMVPLAMLAAVALFRLLRIRTEDDRLALAGALLYAFATPIFFRSGFLNQNAIIAHATLFGFLLLCRVPGRNSLTTGRLAAGGALIGWTVVTDYSGVPIVLAFAGWVAVLGYRQVGLPGALRALALFGLGGLVPLSVLLGYQWVAFGNPLLPAQVYMPATSLSVHGWFGFSLPTWQLLAGNLFDPRYGLFAFCPLLLLAFWHPRRRRPALLEPDERALAWAVFLGVYLFSSANQFGLLQWNTGVRYLLPAAPLLFLLALPVLRGLRPGWQAAWVLLTGTISWAVAMQRESVPVSLAHLFLQGFDLPWLITLRKTAAAYVPFLATGSSPLALFLLVAIVLYLIWRPAAARR